MLQKGRCTRVGGRTGDTAGRHQGLAPLLTSLCSRIARASVPRNTNNALATAAVVRRGIRIVVASVGTSTSTVRIAGHAGTSAPAGSLPPQVVTRRHSFALTDIASVN